MASMPASSLGFQLLIFGSWDLSCFFASLAHCYILFSILGVLFFEGFQIIEFEILPRKINRYISERPISHVPSILLQGIYSLDGNLH